MKFSEKLKIIRKNKGLTQEEFAAKLNLSRQAITQWENGASYPDISNLIQISDFFNVPIDYLVKDNSCEMATEKSTQTEEIKLIKFLLEAKMNTYASKKGKVESSRPNSFEYQYQDANYKYIDTYLGSELFTGEEAVWIDEIPIYAMNYSGRVLSERFSGQFLNDALMRVPENLPFRGPKFYQDGDFLYHCNVNGKLEWFQGYEEIYFLDELVYECYFHGGYVR